MASPLHEYWEPPETEASRSLLDELCAASRRFTTVWELFELRRAQRGEAADWAVDTWAAVGAEVAAAQSISLGAAGSMMHYARALAERLPKVAAVFGEGDVDWRTVQTIIFRTDLIQDAEALKIVDWQLAIRPRGGRR